MNEQIRQFFQIDPSKESRFAEVRLLTEGDEVDWKELKQSNLPRGWFELSRISAEDRLEFVCQFWLSQLPFHAMATEAIEDFFQTLDDVVVALSRQTKEEPWRAELVYSLADNSSFFRGLMPAHEDKISEVEANLSIHFPRDYLAFLRVHNGFGKLSELGIFPVEEVEEARLRLIQIANQIHQKGKVPIDPYFLYPFYEEYGTEGFQCFSQDWYPGSEMGNVHFSSIDCKISDVSDSREWGEELAHPTFIEWLAAFLQGMNGGF